MIGKTWLRIAILTMLLATSAAPAKTVREQMHDPGFHIYSVIFAFSIDQASKLRTFRVVEVDDPASGTNNAVNIPVPAAYVEAARKKMQAKHSEPTLKDGKPAEHFTYFLYEPGHPGAVISDLDQPIDRQP
jgi:hypothetical protein